MSGMSAMEPHHMNGSLGGCPPHTQNPYPPPSPKQGAPSPPPPLGPAVLQHSSLILQSVSSICGLPGTVQGCGGGTAGGWGGQRGWGGR